MNGLTVVVLLIAAACTGAIAWRVHAARRRARMRAQAMLDVLASEVCDALMDVGRPGRGRRAVNRYERTRERVSRARTRRELDAAIRTQRLRLASRDVAARWALSARDVLVAVNEQRTRHTRGAA